MIRLKYTVRGFCQSWTSCQYRKPPSRELGERNVVVLYSLTPQRYHQPTVLHTPSPAPGPASSPRTRDYTDDSYTGQPRQCVKDTRQRPLAIERAAVHFLKNISRLHMSDTSLSKFPAKSNLFRRNRNVHRSYSTQGACCRSCRLYGSHRAI